MTILAQVNWEQAGVFLSGLVVVLGGQKGIESLIVAWRGRRGSGEANGNGSARPVTTADCEKRMLTLNQNDKERHDTIIQAISELKVDLKEVRRDFKTGIAEVHHRVDELFKTL